MAWKEAGGFGETRDIKKDPPGKVTHCGIYNGSKVITTKIGDNWVYNFTAPDGTNFGIFGFTQLNMTMEEVPIGCPVKITYQGTKNVKTKFGMKDVHQVSVQYDPDGIPGVGDHEPNYDADDAPIEEPDYIKAEVEERRKARDQESMAEGLPNAF